jgi:stalled ribosome rescue protein Dom34
MQSWKSARVLAVEMGVGKTQINLISMGKAEIVDDIENNVPGERKQNRQRRNQQFMLELAPEGYNS